MGSFQIIGRIVVGQEDYVIDSGDGTTIYPRGAVRVFGYKVGCLSNGTPRVYLFDSLQDAMQWIDTQEEAVSAERGFDAWVDSYREPTE